MNTYGYFLEAQQQNMVYGLYGKGKGMLGWDAGFHSVWFLRQPSTHSAYFILIVHPSHYHICTLSSALSWPCRIPSFILQHHLSLLSYPILDVHSGHIICPLDKLLFCPVICFLRHTLTSYNNLSLLCTCHSHSVLLSSSWSHHLPHDSILPYQLIFKHASPPFFILTFIHASLMLPGWCSSLYHGYIFHSVSCSSFSLFCLWLVPQVSMLF